MMSISEKPSLKDASQAEAEAEARREGATTSQLGVYTIWTPGRAPKKTKSTTEIVSIKHLFAFHRIRVCLPYVWRFLNEMYSLSPFTMGVLFVVTAMEAITPGLKLYATSRLMSTIESGLVVGHIDPLQARLCLAVYIGTMLGGTLLAWINSKAYLVVSLQARLHFEGMLLEASLRRDFASFDGHSNSAEMDPAKIVSELWHVLTSVLTVGSHVIALMRIATESGVGPTFLCIWMLRVLPLFDDKVNSMFLRGCMYYVSNAAHLRMIALKDIVYSKMQRQEVAGGNIGPYIIDEYKQARKDVGGILSGDFYYILYNMVDPWRDLLDTLLTNFPTLYYGVHVMLGSAPFQFSAIASLQSTTSALQHGIQMLISSGDRSAMGIMTRVRDFYETLDVRPDLDDGSQTYPSKLSSETGMEIVLRNVTFTYPTSQSTRPAIANVSITLGAGQLVVIVGANGSGKTSLVKLLTRLHNPSSGEILIDGVRANEYRVQDLRQAISLLSQDHALFPLSIKENIALGRPYAPDVHGEPAIAEAARKGGAEGFINKFTHKYDTALDPVGTKGAVGLHPQHPIMKLYAKLEKTTEVSGGERQRLVAARTFMRITDEEIKLVIVDEPSAAMDPEGEYELFKHLREARAGRTMVFITHRFGHLTKHADLILCMKEGRLVESGTHMELLKMKGEYCQLYNIQAQAFT